MGKRITYDINGQYFANQKELKAYIKNLKTCPREIEGEEFDFMKAWFEQSQPEQCIPEILRIYVAECWGQPEYKNYHFRVVRDDSTDEELSWWKTDTPLSIFSTACRRAIDIRINELTKGKKNLQVHHDPPHFNKIVKHFIEKYDIDINNVEYREIELNNFKAKVFKDGWMEERFRHFHDMRATLRVITKKEHIEIHEL